MNRKDEINSRGLANGWHAQALENRAKSSGASMADVFTVQVKNSTAFSVPAKCTKVTAKFIYYEFLDGSTTRFINTNGRV